ncbi:RNA-directed DNA polymerase, eukaryota, reverse transcriptase zinc-binding domain protein, partial [Tanacetum coccineum]
MGGSVEEIRETVMKENIWVFGTMDKEYNVENGPAVTNGVSFYYDLNCSSPNAELNAYCNNNPNDEYNSSQTNTNDNNKSENAKKKETYVSIVRKDEIIRKFDYKPLMTNDSGGEFRDIEGLNSVIDQGPWMVNKKPLIVQKWNHEMGMQMVEHSKLPIWARMTEIPLEAWSSDGISTLASSLGNPLFMDTMTATMCHDGMGRLDFARVLVEMNANKEFKETIEVHYRDKDNKVKWTKIVNVSYDWKPAACTHCKVFGHNFNECKTRPRTAKEEILAKKKAEEQSTRNNKASKSGENQTGWRNVGRHQNRFKDNEKQNEGRLKQVKPNVGQFRSRLEYRRKQGERMENNKDKNVGSNAETRKKWSMHKKEYEAL